MACPRCGAGERNIREWSPGYRECCALQYMSTGVGYVQDWAAIRPSLEPAPVRPIAHGYHERCGWRWFVPGPGHEQRAHCSSCTWVADGLCQICATPVCRRHGTFNEQTGCACDEHRPPPAG